jgi:hypothetical protein
MKRSIVLIAATAMLLGHIPAAHAKKKKAAHWMTTQALVPSGTPCTNSTLANQVETVVAEGTSVSEVPSDGSNWQFVVEGGVTLAPTNPDLTFPVQVFGYVGAPTGCSDFPSCSPQMTKIPVLSTMVLGGGASPFQIVAPFNLPLTSLASNQTARFFVTVMPEFSGDTTITCVAAFYNSLEHN